MTLIKKQLCSCGAGRDAEVKFETPDGNMYFCCSEESCKKAFREEIDELSFRASHQGRKRSSYNSSMDAIMYCIYIGGIVSLGYLLWWLMK